MFNKTICIPIVTNTPYARQTTIIEKRAPTDESVRLLKEMEEKAQEKVENVIFKRLDGNFIEFSHFDVTDHVYNMGSDVRILLKINGREFKRTLPCDDFREGNKKQIISNTVAEEVTNYIMSKLSGEVE